MDLLDWLFARQRFGMKPGLGKVRALLERLDRPQEAFKSVLIGGTNGKGSTAATLASILTASGRCTGLFISPHLTKFSERFLVDGQPLADEVITATLKDIKPVAEALGATFFEIVTALGCVLFSQTEVDTAVMEVGLGGRFDATNVLEPSLSIITGVSRDHTKILGETVGEIARDKAGIMRTGKLCLTGAQGDALTVLREEAARVGATLWAVGEELGVEVNNLGWRGLELEVKSPHGRCTLHTPLIGSHQARNVALAAVAGAILGAEGDAIERGVRATRWPGRLEPIAYQDRTFLLDGAHNPEAAAALARAVRELGVERTSLVFGVGVDKEIAEVVAGLEPITRNVILTRARLSPRAAEPEALKAYWHVPTVLADGPEEAVERALEHTPPGEVVLVAGSLYLVGEVRPLLLGEGLEPWARWQ